MTDLVERFRRLARRFAPRACPTRKRGCPVSRARCGPEPLEPRLLLAGDIVQLGYFPTWDNSDIKSVDPSGITYHAPSGHLFIADSEIDQTEYFTGENVFEVSRTDGHAFAKFATGNDEPTGITYSQFDGYFYVTNDDSRTITRYDASLSSPLASVKTRAIDGVFSDPEGITSDQAGNLYIISGKGGGHGVWVGAFDANLQFLYKFTISDRMSDAEGIAYHPTTHHLFVVSADALAVFEYALDGTFIEKYDLSGFSPRPLTPQGLTFAPTPDPHDDPGAMALYIADGGRDEAPDGRVYVAEITGIKALGLTDYRKFQDLQPWAGDVWYSFETAHTAILTIQTDKPDTTLTLFDPSLRRLATSAELNGRQRLDYATNAGKKFLVQLAGTGRDVEFRIANLVQYNGISVLIHGTAHDDQFTFRAATPFSFDGAGGNDTARLYGSRRAGTFTAGSASPSANPQQATLTGNGVAVSVTAENVLAEARGRRASATLYDSADDDCLQSFWKWTQMSGPSYARQVRGFRNVVLAAAGDVAASLGDSASNESPLIQTASYSDAALVDAAIAQTTQQPLGAIPFQDMLELFWLSQTVQPRGKTKPVDGTNPESSQLDLLFADPP